MQAEMQWAHEQIIKMVARIKKDTCQGGRADIKSKREKTIIKKIVFGVQEVHCKAKSRK